jgi:hypothetical protein
MRGKIKRILVLILVVLVVASILGFVKYQERLREGQFKQDGASEFIAKRDLEVNYCFKIYNELRGDNCIKHIATVTRNSSLCKLVRHGTTRDNCYLNLIGEMNDESGCVLIQNIDLKNQCNAKFAILKKDHRLCDPIEKTVIKNDCIVEVAEETQDSNLCRGFNVKFVRDECLKKIEKQFTTEKVFTIVDQCKNLCKEIDYSSDGKVALKLDACFNECENHERNGTTKEYIETLEGVKLLVETLGKKIVKG